MSSSPVKFEMANSLGRGWGGGRDTHIIAPRRLGPFRLLVKSQNSEGCPCNGGTFGEFLPRNGGAFGKSERIHTSVCHVCTYPQCKLVP